MRLTIRLLPQPKSMRSIIDATQYERRFDWARFKVPEWRAFCYTEGLRNRPPRLKLVLSDSTRQGQAAQMSDQPAVQAGWNRQKRVPKTGMCPQAQQRLLEQIVETGRS
jgi:hypothetical protein